MYLAVVWIGWTKYGISNKLHFSNLSYSFYVFLNCYVPHVYCKLSELSMFWAQTWNSCDRLIGMLMIAIFFLFILWHFMNQAHEKHNLFTRWSYAKQLLFDQSGCWMCKTRKICCNFFFLTSHCKSIYKLQKLAHLFVNDLCENPKSDSLSPIKMRWKEKR